MTNRPDLSSAELFTSTSSVDLSGQSETTDLESILSAFENALINNHTLKASEIFLQTYDRYHSHPILQQRLDRLILSLCLFQRDQSTACFFHFPRNRQEDFLLTSATRYENASDFISAIRIYALLFEMFPHTIMHIGMHAAMLAVRAPIKLEEMDEIVTTKIVPRMLNQGIWIINDNSHEDISDFIKIPRSSFFALFHHIQRHYILHRDLRAILDFQHTLFSRSNVLSPDGHYVINADKENELEYIKEFTHLMADGPVAEPEIVFATMVAWIIVRTADLCEIICGERCGGGFFLPMAIASECGNIMGKKRRLTSSSTSSSSSKGDMDVDQEREGRVKRSKSSESVKAVNVMSISSLIHDGDNNEPELPKEQESSSDDYMRLAYEALAGLDIVSHCLHVLEKIWFMLPTESKRGNGWEDLVMILLNDWSMPLSIHNAVLLVLAEIELHKNIPKSNPMPLSFTTSLQYSLTRYRQITDRVTMAWRQKKSSSSELSSSSSSSVLETPPITLTIRAIYCIATIYLTVGWSQEARKELLIVLSVVGNAAAQDQEGSSALSFERSEYARGNQDLKPLLQFVSTKSLITICIRLLAFGYWDYVRLSSQESEQWESKSTRSLDDAIGSLIVLLQFVDSDLLEIKESLFAILWTRGYWDVTDFWSFIYQPGMLTDILKCHTHHHVKLVLVETQNSEYASPAINSSALIQAKLDKQPSRWGQDDFKIRVLTDFVSFLLSKEVLARPMSA